MVEQLVSHHPQEAITPPERKLSLLEAAKALPPDELIQIKQIKRSGLPVSHETFRQMIIVAQAQGLVEPIIQSDHYHHNIRFVTTEQAVLAIENWERLKDHPRLKKGQSKLQRRDNFSLYKRAFGKLKEGKLNLW